jgi:hypothetical protein
MLYIRSLSTILRKNFHGQLLPCPVELGLNNAKLNTVRTVYVSPEVNCSIYLYL